MIKLRTQVSMEHSQGHEMLKLWFCEIKKFIFPQLVTSEGHVYCTLDGLDSHLIGEQISFWRSETVDVTFPLCSYFN